MEKGNKIGKLVIWTRRHIQWLCDSKKSAIDENYWGTDKTGPGSGDKVPPSLRNAEDNMSRYSHCDYANSKTKCGSKYAHFG